MEDINFYATRNDYCSICLRSSFDLTLFPNTANDFFSIIQVNVLTPWLCVACTESVHKFQQLKHRAQRAQCFLNNVRLPSHFVQQNLDYFKKELNEIKWMEVKQETATYIQPLTGVQSHTHKVTTDTQRNPQNCIQMQEVKIEPDETQDNLHHQDSYACVLTHTPLKVKEESDVTHTKNPLKLMASNHVAAENINIAPNIINIAPVNINIVPENINIAPRNINIVPNNIHIPQRNINIVPKNIIIAPENINVAPHNINIIPKNIIKAPKPGLWMNIEMVPSRPSSASTSKNTQELKLAVVKSNTKIDDAKKSLIPVKLVNTKGIPYNFNKVLRPMQVSENDTKVFISEKDDVKSIEMVKSKIKSKKLTPDEHSQWCEKQRNTDEFRNSVYKCEDCALSFSTIGCYKRHMDHHSESCGKLQCDICKLYFGLPKGLSKHKALHTSNVCVVCDFESNSYQGCVDHYFSQHTQIKFHCWQCDYQGKGPHAVRSHILTRHQRLRYITKECDVCNETVNKKKLKEHMLMHTKNSTAKVECNECGKKILNEIKLKEHMEKIHSGKERRREECLVCKKSVLFASMNTHMRTHQDTNDVDVCSVCARIFGTKFALENHMKRKHSNVLKKFECHDCGKRCFCKPELQSHIYGQHLKLDMFKCRTCDQRFKTKQSLHLHVRVVHKKVQQRKKLCEVCGKWFCITTYKQHILIHSGEKPHVCEECGRAFRQRAAMQTHIKLKHRGIKYKDLMAARKKMKKKP